MDMGSLFSLLGVKPAVEDSPQAVPLPRPPKGQGLAVELRDVRFSYYKDDLGGGADGSSGGGGGGGGGEGSGSSDGSSSSSPSPPPRRPILDGLSLFVPEGTSCALVGESGSGKSTVLRLVARLYDADSGAVLVGGRDVKSVTVGSLRRCVGVVPQDVTLFNDSIAANIAYGRADCGDDSEGLGGGGERQPEGSLSPSSSSVAHPFATQAEIEAAASAAAVHDAILAMPNGYATVVGERGLKLSGGEKQRVALARAFARAPPLLLLDEPTSAHDAASEAEVLDALRRLAAGRTAVLVAHRLSTAAACDQVVVLEKGKAVERGTHEELLAVEGGAYAALWAKASEAAAGGKISSSAAAAAAAVSEEQKEHGGTSSLLDVGDDGERAAAAARAAAARKR